MFLISIRKDLNDVPYSFENLKIFVQYRSRSLIYSLTQKKSNNLISFVKYIEDASH